MWPLNVAVDILTKKNKWKYLDDRSLSNHLFTKNVWGNTNSEVITFISKWCTFVMLVEYKIAFSFSQDHWLGISGVNQRTVHILLSCLRQKQSTIRPTFYLKQKNSELSVNTNEYEIRSLWALAQVKSVIVFGTKCCIAFGTFSLTSLVSCF